MTFYRTARVALAASVAALSGLALASCTSMSSNDFAGTYIDASGFEQVIVDDGQVIVVRSDERTLEEATTAIDDDRLGVDAGYRFAVGSLDTGSSTVTWATIPDYVSGDESEISLREGLLVIGSTSYFATDSESGRNAREAARARIDNIASVDPEIPEAEQPVLLLRDGEYVAADRENPASLVRIVLDGDYVTRELISCDGGVSVRSTGSRTAWEFQWDNGTGSGTTVYPHPTGSERDEFELDHVDFTRLGSEEAQQVMSGFRHACGS